MKPFAWCLILAFFFVPPGQAAEKQPHANKKVLMVGTKEAPPFSMLSENGTWSGISIELWRQIAIDLNYSYEFKSLDLRGLLDELQNGHIDAAVAALTVTSEREEMFDFTHPFYSTGLGIAVNSNRKNSSFGLLKALLSYNFLKAILGLVTLIFVAGVLIWLFERKRNPEQFGGGIGKGLASGFWWSAVTMTTVGYGDKAPGSLGGRLIAVIWMFAAVITISTFTAAISSSLTVSQLESFIKGPEDLSRVRVGTIAETTSSLYLQKRHITYQSYTTAAEGLRALMSDQIDSFVYDVPLLRYLINTQYVGSLEVLPSVFMAQDYAIGLPAGSPLREPINRSLLQKISDPAWQNTLYRYLGQR